MPRPVSIQGTVTLENDETVQFHIDPHSGRISWGAPTIALGDAVDLLTDLEEAAREHLTDLTTLDREASNSRQHFIDTGEYLTHAEVEEYTT